MSEDLKSAPGQISKEAMDYLSSQFELAFSTVLADREKVRGKAWQALGIVGALVAFFTNMVLTHLGDWPLPAHVFASALSVRLLMLALPLARETWLPKKYESPGEEPSFWLGKDAALDAALQCPANIMAAHAIRLQRRIDANRRIGEAEALALGNFVTDALWSPVIPAALAVGCWIVVH